MTATAKIGFMPRKERKKMRYFRHDPLKPEKRKMVTQERVLTAEEKKRDRQGRVLNALALAAKAAIFCLFFGGCLVLIAHIPLPESPFLRLLAIIGIFIVAIAAFLLCGLLASLAAAPIDTAAQKRMVIKGSNSYDAAIPILREYYGWTEPCIVTKCYDSNDKRFKNRDICLFVADGELRLTANLRHGFSVREADLGCYAFTPDDITSAQIPGEHGTVTVLTSGEHVFSLGRRAKGYIRKFIEGSREGGASHMVAPHTYLFDFDGTLVDSMPTFISVMLRILDEHGIVYGEDIVSIITPLGYGGTADYYRTLGLTVPREELVEQMMRYAQEEYTHRIPAKDTVTDTLREMRARGMSLNVLTASPHSMLDPCLKRLGIFELFDHVWSCDDFKTTKADPHIYAAAAEAIGVPIDRITFVDDNIGAVRTAKAAGMHVAAIYDPSSADCEAAMRGIADRYLYTLAELLT